MKINKSFHYPFVLLGDRNYVQASNQTYGLIEALKSWSIGKVDRIIGNFHHIIQNQCRYDVFDNNKEKNLIQHGYSTIFQIIGNKDQFAVGLKPLSEKVVTSVDYDETQLISGHELDKKRRSVALEIDKNQLINKIIALNKQMHTQLFSQQGHSNWFVSKIELNWQALHSIAPFRIEIRLLREMRSLYTKSQIRLDQNTVGYIYFSRRPAHDRN
jgi:hypothetical protein